MSMGNCAFFSSNHATCIPVDLHRSCAVVVVCCIGFARSNKWHNSNWPHLKEYTQGQSQQVSLYSAQFWSSTTISPVTEKRVAICSKIILADLNPFSGSSKGVKERIKHEAIGTLLSSARKGEGNSHKNFMLFFWIKDKKSFLRF